MVNKPFFFKCSPIIMLDNFAFNNPTNVRSKHLQQKGHSLMWNQLVKLKHGTNAKMHMQGSTKEKN
jgi:hypothetical protein